jgi:hypothetical protein
MQRKGEVSETFCVTNVLSSKFHGHFLPLCLVRFYTAVNISIRFA